MIHYQLDDQQHAAVSEAKRNGAQFDLWEALCRTGDGHRQGTRFWPSVTCPKCLSRRFTGPDREKANGYSEQA